MRIASRRIKGLVPRDLWIDRQATRLNEPDPKRSYNNLDYAPCWAPPTVARGKLYIHYSDRLTCYDMLSPADAPATSTKP